MKKMLLGIAAGAALIVPAIPGQAEHWSDPTFIAAANVRVHRGPSGGLHDAVAPPAGRRDGRGHHDGRGGRGDGDGDFLGWYYPQDFDGDRSFDPDKFNDWWQRTRGKWIELIIAQPGESAAELAAMFAQAEAERQRRAIAAPPPSLVARR